MDIYEKKAQMIKERNEQEALRDKYGIEENVVVKETSNMFKFTVKTAASVIRFIASAVLIVLAAIGLISLIYTDVREPLFTVLENAAQEVLK